MSAILVVDDEEGVRSFICEALESEGHRVTAAEDGQHAWEIASKRHFDVVITDLQMPRLDGMGLLVRLRDTQPDVEVIVLTAHGSVESAVEAMRQGAFEYLQKPVSGPSELRIVVERALERRSFLTLRAARPSSDTIQMTWGAPAMRSVVDEIGKVAATSATVLLLGESGTGKEIAARAIHAMSDRAEGPFVAVNCAAISESLLESELFGHEKGAFSGATTRRLGRLEIAQKGTFFLDEIGELQPALQAKLLRVLQERSFERVGGNQTVETDARWIAATHRNLAEEIKAGRFREDLYHRLAVFPVTLPPLRDRREDIPGLVSLLLSDIAASLGRRDISLSNNALTLLCGAHWRGNIRELRNTLERAAILSGHTTISASHIRIDSITDMPAVTSALPEVPLADLEELAIRQALDSVGGNRKHAAERLGIGLRTLYEKLKRYDL